jgi:predicted transcriptional regulator
MDRHNMGLQQWKKTLKKIGITYGEEKHAFMSEVEYREKVVACINEMLKNNIEEIVSGSLVTRGETSRSSSISGAAVSGLATQPSNEVRTFIPCTFLFQVISS